MPVITGFRFRYFDRLPSIWKGSIFVISVKIRNSIGSLGSSVAGCCCLFCWLGPVLADETLLKLARIFAGVKVSAMIFSMSNGSVLLAADVSGVSAELVFFWGGVDSSLSEA